jgi:glycosyltransferase involved in cell wall biosynthesis
MVQPSAKCADAAPTLVVIAKNESRCIERCLRSAQPYVGRMLVLDTGSTDGTPELARACGAEVHFFDWIDDFSAARNRALELADAHWSLFLDADEWIDPESSFQWPTKTSQAQLGLIRMMNIDQSSGMDLPVSSWLPRLLPRGVRYEGRIHEQPASQLPRVRSGLTVVHDGYLKEQLQKKQGRNRRLLTQALQAEPDDPYLLYQFGTEHEGAKEYAAAADLYQKALALLTVRLRCNWII